MSLLKKTVSGVKWTSVSAVTIAALGLLQIALLTRLLPKEDFGLFATVSVIIGLGAYFVEAGLGNAVIHKQEATASQLSTAYVINLILGFVIFGAIFSFAELAAAFFGDERLSLLLRIGSVVFLIQPLGMQYAALLQRDLQFSVLSKVDMLNAAVGLMASVLLAWKYGGPESLVFSYLISAVVRTGVLLLIGVNAYGFRLSYNRVDAGFFLRFGIFQIGENVANYINSNIDVILIGKLLGQEALGVFHLAKQIVFKPMQVINPVVTRVALPAFGKIQSQPDVVRQGYIDLIRVLAVVNSAIYISLAIFSDVVVKVLFGVRWIDSVIIIKVLCLYTFFRAMLNPVGSLQIALGRVERGFYWNAFLLLVVPVVVSIGSIGGLLGIVFALSMTMLFIQVAAWYFLIRPLCGAGFGEYFSSIAAPFVLAASCFSIGFVIDDFWIRCAVYLIGLIVYMRCVKSTIYVSLKKNNKY